MYGWLSFGHWLKQRRKALDLTQHELARLVGCAVVTIQKIEEGQRRPSKQVAERLAEQLTIPVEERGSFLHLARAGVPADRPALSPLRLDTATNLPTSLTSLIGRAADVAVVGERLARDDVRLLTLVGPPGVGKTRLSVQAAGELCDRFPDGVWFVALAPIRESHLVAPLIAHTLGLAEAGTQPPLEQLKTVLRAKQTLLVLDNFEQIVVAAPLVTELLAACRQLKVLTTSRTPLHVYGEHEFAVEPLAVPARASNVRLAELMDYAAVQLFVARVRAFQPDFALTAEHAPAIAEICRRLDGLPLAIELTAARLKLFAPEALLARLSGRLALLSGGPRDLPARQQTIRNTIDWSYDLLTAAEQTILRRLGVFVGGCTLAAAEAVCAGVGSWGLGIGSDSPTPNSQLPTPVLDGLAALVDKSLLRQGAGPGGDSRFTMLETIREYALEQLEASGEAERLRQQHAEHYLLLAEAAARELEQRTAQFTWFERLEAEFDNLRAALQWALAQHEAALALRLATALRDFWEARGYWTEGYRWLAAALAASSNAAVEPALRAKALLAIAWVAHCQGNFGGADALFGESLALFQALGDTASIAAVLARRAVTAWKLGDFRRVVALREEQLALDRALGNRHGIADALLGLGWIAHDSGNFGQAFALLEESLALRRALDDQPGIAFGLFALGVAAYQHGDFPQAAAWCEASLTMYQALGDKGDMADVLAFLGSIAAYQGDLERSARLLDEALALFQELGSPGGIALIRRFQGKAALQQRDWARAHAAFQESLRLQQGVGGRWEIAACLEGLAAVADGQNQAERAAQLSGAVEALREQMGAPVSPVDRSWYDAAITHARAAIGDAAFAAAWAAGRAMTLEQAIAEALGGSPIGNDASA